MVQLKGQLLTSSSNTMKLFPLALLAFATVAVAIPAPQAIPSPDARQSTNVTWDPTPGATGDLPPLSDFWPYSVTITESFDVDKLVVMCDFQNAQDTTRMDLGSKEGGIYVQVTHWVKVTDLWLEIQYNFDNHCKRDTVSLKLGSADLRRGHL
jgi:hypothetical protein